MPCIFQDAASLLHKANQGQRRQPLVARKLVKNLTAVSAPD